MRTAENEAAILEDFVVTFVLSKALLRVLVLYVWSIIEFLFNQ